MSRRGTTFSESDVLGYTESIEFYIFANLDG